MWHTANASSIACLCVDNTNIFMFTMQIYVSNEWTFEWSVSVLCISTLWRLTDKYRWCFFCENWNKFESFDGCWTTGIPTQMEAFFSYETVKIHTCRSNNRGGDCTDYTWYVLFFGFVLFANAKCIHEYTCDAEMLSNEKKAGISFSIYFRWIYFRQANQICWRLHLSIKCSQQPYWCRGICAHFLCRIERSRYFCYTRFVELDLELLFVNRIPVRKNMRKNTQRLFMPFERISEVRSRWLNKK